MEFSPQTEHWLNTAEAVLRRFPQGITEDGLAEELDVEPGVAHRLLIQLRLQGRANYGEPIFVPRGKTQQAFTTYVPA